MSSPSTYQTVDPVNYAMARSEDIRGTDYSRQKVALSLLCIWVHMVPYCIGLFMGDVQSTDLLEDSHRTVTVTMDMVGGSVPCGAKVMEEGSQYQTVLGHILMDLDCDLVRLEGVLRESSYELVMMMATCREEVASKKVIHSSLCALSASGKDEGNGTESTVCFCG